MEVTKVSNIDITCSYGPYFRHRQSEETYQNHLFYLRCSSGFLRPNQKQLRSSESPLRTVMLPKRRRKRRIPRRRYYLHHCFWWVSYSLYEGKSPFPSRSHELICAEHFVSTCFVMNASGRAAERKLVLLLQIIRRSLATCNVLHAKPCWKLSSCVIGNSLLLLKKK